MNWYFQVYRQSLSPWVFAILGALFVVAFQLHFILFSDLAFIIILLPILKLFSLKSFTNTNKEFLFFKDLLNLHTLPNRFFFQSSIYIHNIFNLLMASATSKPDAEKPAGEAATFTTLTITNNYKTELLRFSEIVWLQSDNSGVEIQTIRKKYVLYRSLRSIEQELDTQQFVRIHRSAIVNRAFIESINQLPGGDGYVTLTTGEEIRYSRNYKKDLLDEID